MCELIARIRPDEVYNLGAQSHVKVSFGMSEYTAEVDGVGTLRLLNAIRMTGLASRTRFYQVRQLQLDGCAACPKQLNAAPQASTSELYGLVQEIPQSETTPFYPRSPYGVPALVQRRAAHKPSCMLTSSVARSRCKDVRVLDRGELPRGVQHVRREWHPVQPREPAPRCVPWGACAARFALAEPRAAGPTFVTRKITRAVARIHKGKQACLYLGNLDAKRDWGHAQDYVEVRGAPVLLCARQLLTRGAGQAMWMMLQAERAEDFVVATGETHSVREFVERAFSHVGITIQWRGEGVEEVGADAADPERVLVRVDPEYFRPTEVRAEQPGHVWAPLTCERRARRRWSC